MKKEGELTFGEFFQTLRQERGLTLRDFCKKAGADPANISRMERGAMPPPEDHEILERYALGLDLKQGSNEWYKFFDLASLTKGMIPKSIMDDQELVKKLPVFFRTLRGQKPTEQELKRLAEKLRKHG